MPSKFTLPKRKHNQFRRVSVTFDFVFQNPNPLHVWDACDMELERIIKRSAQNNLKNTMVMNNETETGFIQGDFIDRDGFVNVHVKSRECELHGKPLSFFKRLRYLLMGRYWY